ncbi:MAG: hypothetical protein IJ629_07085 [Clostridia bacterium]|nr:hypothetical protein [Clostridia bacterium]
MATNKNHFLGFLAFQHVYAGAISDPKGRAAYFFTPYNAAVVTTNDSVRCWSGNREYTHFTINPLTKQVSWCYFPKEQVKKWTKELIDSQMVRYSYGKPGTAVVDEATIPAEMWQHNDKTSQNKLFYLHLIQDGTYDRFIRSVIDVSRRYEDVYIFEGKEYTGAQIRGEGMERWSKGLLAELDDQFYVRLAKRLYDYTRVKADRRWIEKVMIRAIHTAYSPELAEATVKFVSLSDKANQLIAEGRFDDEVWPIPNSVVDCWIDWFFEDMFNAFIELNVL